MTSRSEPDRGPFWRERTGNGEQLLIIDDRYTWSWAGEPDLDVGDVVLLPGNPWTRDKPYRGVVTALGSDYLGPVRQVLGRCDPGDYPTFDQLTLW